MGLQSEIMLAMKEAMKLKDKVTLETLRAVKAELLKIQTASSASSEVPGKARRSRAATIPAPVPTRR